MSLTQQQLAHVMPLAGRFTFQYFDHLSAAIDEYEINTATRVQAFLAQLAEESGELRYARELWGPTPQQARYERVFTAEWSKDDPTNRLAFRLGNEEAGDGHRFLGRGLIQITGRFNYGECSKALFGGPHFLWAHPETLESPQAACRSAAWYWASHRCNEAADAGDFELVTRRVNGGLTHYDRRCVYWQRAKEAITEG